MQNMHPEQKWANQVRNTLTDYFEQIRFARAAELARHGHYLEAEALLCPLGALPENPNEIDLLARIAAQQRQYRRAEELWKRAVLKTGTGATFPLALEALERLRAQKQLHRELQREIAKGFLFFLLYAAVTALAVALCSGLR